MDIHHVTQLLMVASLVALVASSPLPYGLQLDQQPQDWEDALSLLNDVDKLRLLLKLQAADEIVYPPAPHPTSEQAVSKRFDFGFSGLDNIDHILTTLDRNEATRPRGRTLKQQFIAPASRPHDIDKLKKLMQSVG